jgi:DNA-directed RNA polymerase subunit RPC12/RpoP
MVYASAVTYRCSACHKPVGPMLDKKGQPEPFRCPHSGRIAEAVPDGEYGALMRLSMN